MTIEEDNAALLKEIGQGLITDSTDEGHSIGKDMHLMMQEFTDDKNRDKLTTLAKRDVPGRVMMRVIADIPNYDAKKYRRGRYFVIDRWNYHESIISMGIKNYMATLLKDFGGYMLAFRGGVEWRQAGIMGNDMMMDEQKKSVIEKLKQ